MCEARERGAGLALVFASGAELERFIAAVEQAFCALTVSTYDANFHLKIHAESVSATLFILKNFSAYPYPETTKTIGIHCVYSLNAAEALIQLLVITYNNSCGQRSNV